MGGYDAGDCLAVPLANRLDQLSQRLQETSSCLYGFDGVAFESSCLFHVVVSCLCPFTTHLSPRTLHSHTCLQETVVNGKQKGKCTKQPHAVSTKMRQNVENQCARSHFRACLLVYHVSRVQLRVPVRHRRLLYLRHKTHLEQESTQRPVEELNRNTVYHTASSAFQRVTSSTRS